MSVFESADRDNDGNLNRDEFFSGLCHVCLMCWLSAAVMQSNSLGLNLSLKEVEEVYVTRTTWPV